MPVILVMLKEGFKNPSQGKILYVCSGSPLGHCWRVQNCQNLRKICYFTHFWDINENVVVGKDDIGAICTTKCIN